MAYKRTPKLIGALLNSLHRTFHNGMYDFIIPREESGDGGEIHEVCDIQ